MKRFRFPFRFARGHDRLKSKILSRQAFSVREGSRRGQLEAVTRRAEGRTGFWGVACLWGIFGATVVYAAVFSPFLLIDHVTVVGAEQSDAARVEAFVRERLVGRSFGMIPRGNFLLVRSAALERALAFEFPLLRSVAVTREFPTGLAVRVEERDAIVLWCSGGPCYRLDDDGRAREGEPALRAENRPFVITVTELGARPVAIGETVSDASLPVFVSTLVPAFRERFGIGLGRDFTTASRFAGEVGVRTEEGWEVLFNTNVPIQTALDDLALLFDQGFAGQKRADLTSVDLRTEHRIYYVMKDASGQPVAPETVAVPSAPLMKPEKK